MSISVWHNENDTRPYCDLPTHSVGRCEVILHIPFGVWTDAVPIVGRTQRRVVTVVIDVEFDGRHFKLTFGDGNRNGIIRTVTKKLIAFETFLHPERAEWYRGIEEGLNRSKGNRYFEAIVPKIPSGTNVYYRATITPMPVGPLRNDRPQKLEGTYPVPATLSQTG